MMSDERWEQLAIEGAIHNFIIINGRKPADEDEAVKWQRVFIGEIMAEMEEKVHE